MNQNLQIGDILSRSGSIYMTNFIPFTMIAAIILIPSLLLSLCHIPFNNSTLEITCITISSFWTFVAGSLISGCIIYGSFSTLKGVQVKTSDSISVAVSRFMAVFGTAFIVGILCMLGMVMCIVPGIIASIFLYVATPAAVLEKLGPIEAINRSIELTEGNKLNIFLLSIIVFGLMIVVFFGLGMFEGIFEMAIKSKDVLILTKSAFAFTAYVLETFITAWSATLVTVVYHDLHKLREGSDINDLLAALR